MDLGLTGKTALVCAASRGLGRACAFALAREGVALVITGRTEQTLERTAEEIRAETGAAVVTAVGDIATAQGRAAALASCPSPDILVNNAGGPPQGDFRDWSRDTWIAAVDANMLAPISLIQSVIDGMCERRFGRIVNITSATVKAPQRGLGLSNGVRAGLTGFVAGLAREVCQYNVTINSLLPGPFDTDRLRNAAQTGGVSYDVLRAQRSERNPSKRIGEPEEFGAACAFLCAATSGFIVGQNLVMDGGAFNSTMG